MTTNTATHKPCTTEDAELAVPMRMWITGAGCDYIHFTAYPTLSDALDEFSERVRAARVLGKARPTPGLPYGNVAHLYMDGAGAEPTHRVVVNGDGELRIKKLYL